MKRCLACTAEFVGGSWVCPECSWSPTMNEFPMFAPAFAESAEHYPSDAVDQLGPREERYFWSVARNQLISGLLARDLPDARTLLEVGCGMGGVLAYLREKHPELALTGADLMPETLRVAQERVPDATLIQADIRQIPYSEEFDVVCALDVIEHIDEDAMALAEIARTVSPGGGVVVAVPQHMWLWGAWDELMRHRRRYSRNGLLELLDAAGLELVRVTSSFSFVLPFVYLSRFRDRKLARGVDPYRALRIPEIVNRSLGALTRVERSIIFRGISLPVGSSLTVVARRHS